MTQQITAQLLKGGLTVDASGNVTATGRFSGPTQRTGTIKAQDGTTAITIADSTGVVTVTSPVINTGVSGSAILDEDAMGSDSATKLATQQSIKAYVDASGIPGISSTGATSTDTVTIAGNLTVDGTTTTLDTTLENVDKLEVGANSTDYGAKINQAGTGDILQLQDNGTNVFVVEDGGNVGIGTDAPAHPLNITTEIDNDYQVVFFNEDSSGQGLKVKLKGNDATFLPAFNVETWDTGTTYSSKFWVQRDGKVSIGTSSGRETTNQQKLVVGSSIKVGCGNHTPPQGAAGNFFGIDIQMTANNVAQAIKLNTHSEACFYLICGHYSSDRWTDVICTGPGTVYAIDQRTTQGSGITRSYSVSGEKLYLTINDSNRSWSIFVTAMGANETATTSSPCEGSLAV